MKKLCLLIAILILSLMLTGCYATQVKEQDKDKDKPESMFVMVEATYYWRIVYDKETKVMYAVSYVSNGAGKFTLLVNADGTPKLWKGE